MAVPEVFASLRTTVLGCSYKYSALPEAGSHRRQAFSRQSQFLLKLTGGLVVIVALLVSAILA